MSFRPAEEQYRLNDWILTTPITGMFNGDNAAVLSRGSRGVAIPRAQHEGIFDPARANKVVTYGLSKNDGVVVITDSKRSGFLVAQIDLHQGIGDETFTIIQQMESPIGVLIDHKQNPMLRSSGAALALLNKQSMDRNMLPFMSERQILPDGSADVGFINWDGKLIVNVRSTSG